MATIVATFTDAGNAARAAAALQASGLSGVAVGSSDTGPSSFLGLGETVESFKGRITLGSTIGGAATGAAALGFLGFVSMGFTELRNMATLDQVPGLIAWTLSWVGIGLVLGLVAGFAAGLLAANYLATAAERAAAQGQGVPRPQLTVPVADAAAEEMAYSVLKSVGVYEIDKRPNRAAR